MDFAKFSAARDDDGRRCDKVLRKLLDGVPLSAIYAAMRKNLVRVNGKRASPGDRIRAGDVVSVASVLLDKSAGAARSANAAVQNENAGIAKSNAAGFAQNENAALFRNAPHSLDVALSRDFPCDIIFHNDNFLVVNKPYGAKSQGADSIAEEVARLYRESAGSRSLSFSPGPLHRLDARASGILVFSWSIAGARFFSDALQKRLVEKTYIAVVEGRMEGAALWSDFIKKENAAETPGAGRPFQKSRVFAEGGKNDLAITSAEPLAYGAYKGSAVTLVRFRIRTGRHHQIRAASAAHGFPLLGDTAYGAKPLDAPQKLFLHAGELLVPENALGFPRPLSAPPPAAFAKLRAALFG